MDTNKEAAFELPTLETERVILRKISIVDAKEMYEYGSDPRVSEYVTWPTHESMEDTLTFLRYVEEKYKKGENYDWGIVHKEDNKFIGTCSLFSLNKAHQRAEIGYVLARPYWGQGIMTEVVERVIKFCFEELGLNRVQAHCMVQNVGSERVMKKVGMSYEGTIREQMLVKGQFYDFKLYSILKSDYDKSLYSNL